MGLPCEETVSGSGRSCSGLGARAQHFCIQEDDCREEKAGTPPPRPRRKAMRKTFLGGTAAVPTVFALPMDQVA